MAKKATATRTKEKEEKVPAIIPAASIPANVDEQEELRRMMKEDAGRGVSSDQADNLVPLIYILQKGSPQVQIDGAAYIKGAKAGTIWLKNNSDPLIDGKKGMLFQPCYFDKCWVEWVPRTRGGGRRGEFREHDDESQDQFLKRVGARAVPDKDNPNKITYFLKNGNELVETRYHMGYVLDHGATAFPYCIPLKGTGHSFSKAWMTMFNSVSTDDGEIAASWSRAYRLITTQRQNAAGDWYMFEATLEGDGPLPYKDYMRGRLLNFAFEKKEKRIQTEDEETVTHDTDTM